MVTTRPNAHSYIIKRPRLTKLLDESEARIILLCAPAGYGKTTLAREWVEGQGGPVAWYSGGREMLDYAALAAGLALTLTPLGLPDHTARALAALAAKPTKPRLLGRELATAASSSVSGIIVIDDYHESIASPDSEDFLQALIESLTTRVVLTSRLRPSWFASRLHVYGEAL